MESETTFMSSDWSKNALHRLWQRAAAQALSNLWKANNKHRRRDMNLKADWCSAWFVHQRRFAPVRVKLEKENSCFNGFKCLLAKRNLGPDQTRRSQHKDILIRLNTGFNKTSSGRWMFYNAGWAPPLSFSLLPVFCFQTATSSSVLAAEIQTFNDSSVMKSGFL